MDDEFSSTLEVSFCVVVNAALEFILWPTSGGTLVVDGDELKKVLQQKP